VYIADTFRVRKVSPAGIITTVAGDGSPGFSGDGGPATNAQLAGAYGIAVDSTGTLFIADPLNSRVRRVSRDGIITTVAGNGTFGFSGDGGPAINAQLNAPFAVAVDNSGNLFFEDHNNRRIRKVSPSGIITTVAGGGTSGWGDGGPATSAQIGPSAGIAVDRTGNLFIGDASDGLIRKVSTSGIISTVAGNGPNPCCYLGDGGPAIEAQLNPLAVAVDDAGGLFIADVNYRVRKISASGVITTVAGTGTRGSSGDGGAAVNAQLDSPRGLAVGLEESLFIAHAGRIRKVSSNGIISTVAGGGTLSGAASDGGPATSAQIDPSAVAADKLGNLFIADYNRIRKVSPDGTITTVAGDGTAGDSGDGGPATSAQVGAPNSLAIDAAGNLLITQWASTRIRKITPDGIITTLAEVTQASQTNFPSPTGIAADAAGNVFFVTVCDDCAASGYVGKLSPQGTLSTVAGAGPPGYSGDGGLATNALLYATDVAVDGVGNIYIAGEYTGVVRILRPIERPVWIGAVLDAASEKHVPVAPGKLIVIYGAGLGPQQLITQPNHFATELGGTTVSFNGSPTEIIYSSATQVAARAPDLLDGTQAQVTVTYQGGISAPFTVQVAPSAPSLFTVNQTGAGQAVALNADGTANSALNPVKPGESITLYATGEGRVAISDPPCLTACDALLHPGLPVSVSIGGIQATLQCAGRRPGEGVMQVTARVPNGVQPGGYVPVVLKVGDASTTPDAVWIAISAN
jgi:uncharacterized protein (TIGR03437 family)